MQTNSPYHAGEIAVQEATNERASAIRNGRAVADAIMSGALKFIEQRSMLIVGSVSRDGDVWCSLVSGPSGFATAPDERHVRLDLQEAGSHDRDPLWDNIKHHEQVGALAIDLLTRRRLRINGPLRQVNEHVYELKVVEAYPNCPQYIQRRQLTNAKTGATPSTRCAEGDAAALGDMRRRLIESVDTFFVASAHPERGADASHRGGDPGFVRFVGTRTLRIPDYRGNGMFNTLGNLQVHPRAGLLFVDFDSGRTLQLKGEATIQLKAAQDQNQPTGGTGRYWDFAIDRWIDAPMTQPLNAAFLDSWPRNPH